MSRAPERSTRAARTTADPDLWFFLSFAESTEREDGRVRTFFRDLCDEVRAVGGIRGSDPAPVGFLSHASLRSGVDWSEQILAALGTCRVFVALCSPAYFASDSCGREWRAFADRLAAYRRSTKRSAPTLLPVPWRPTPIPAQLGTIQYVDREWPAAVLADGLAHVMRLKRGHDDYHEFVGVLAGQIVRTARDHPIPPARLGPDFARLPYDFPTVSPPERTIPEQRPGGTISSRQPSTGDGARRPPDLSGGNELPRLHGT
ncbi:TIR-like protein FxsC [Micromonospora sp. NPDC050495]|uniref:TIR-like protein FxsC n=1 Tax=Micromonospora sp. NPDC050495 TaxID=3154936 RepID=UPI00341107C6